MGSAALLIKFELAVASKFLLLFNFAHYLDGDRTMDPLPFLPFE